METKTAVREKTQERLERLGLKTASAKVKELATRKRKMMIAGEFYRIVRPEKITEFNNKLRERTMVPISYSYDKLSFTALQNYADAPPPEVLDALELAQSRECFDSYEIAHIIKEVKVPDPILFGVINGCSDKFYISQWDDDVKIEDILKENEG